MIKYTVGVSGRKKILMTADTLGGVWNYALELSRALEAYNTDVYLVTMGKPLSSGQKEEAGFLENLHIISSSYKLEWMHDPWEDIRKAGLWLIELEKVIQPDVIHLNNYAFGNLPWQAPVLMVCHSCVYSWWKAVKGTLPPDNWLKYKEIVKQGLNCVDTIVGITRAITADILDNYKIDWQKIKIVYNGVEPHLFYDKPKEDYVFAMGRIWDEAKNLRIFSTVAPWLDWKVMIAGDNRLPDSNKKVHIKNVDFLGPLPHLAVREYLSKAAIYAHPAWYEPFGLAPLEAAFSGCALILSDIKTLREVWGDAALYADPENPYEWLFFIEQLSRDPWFRKEMVDKARERATRYTAANMARQYSILYNKLIYNKKEKPLAV